MSESLVPLVRWSQDKTHVSIKFQILDARDVQFHFNEECQELFFQCHRFDQQKQRQSYSTSLVLFAPLGTFRIVPSASFVDVIVEKKEKVSWPRLVKSTEKNNKIQIDWDTWVDEEEEEEKRKQAEEEKLAKQAEAEAKKSKSKSKSKSNPIQSPMIQAYLFFYNVFMTLGWLYVVARLTIHHLFVSGFSQQDQAYLEDVYVATVVLQCVATLEIVHSFARLVSGSFVGSIMLHGGRDVILFGIIRPFLSLHTHWSSLALFFVWGFAEIFRYSLYVFQCFTKLSRAFRSPVNKAIASLTKVRYTLPLFILPVGFLMEVAVVYHGLPLLASVSLFFDLISADKLVLFYSALAYAVGAPYLYMLVLKQRQKKL